MAGIYIPSIEYPTDCSRKGCPHFACVAAYQTEMICTILHEYVEPNKKNPRCPVIYVPDHGDLIDRDEIPYDKNAKFGLGIDYSIGESDHWFSVNKESLNKMEVILHSDKVCENIE